MSTLMRVGVAGAGLIGRRHIELIAAAPDCVVAGIADPTVKQRHSPRRITILGIRIIAVGTLAVVEAVKQAARTGERISPNQLVEQAA